MTTVNEILNLELPIVLASKSPRRKSLLKQLGLEFEVYESHCDETIDLDIPPEAYAIHLAWLKAENVAGIVDHEAIVIGADTIVVLLGKILNKPKSEKEAFEMLKMLSGFTHTVYTGLCLINSKDRTWLTSYQSTEVTFRELSDDEILAYIKTGSPMDKAGAYGIQDDFGAVFVSHINGCYYNIVGLPLELLYVSLRKFV